MTAARALGIGRTTAYGLAKKGEFPCKVIRYGDTYRVPTAEILRVPERPDTRYTDHREARDGMTNATCFTAGPVRPVPPAPASDRPGPAPDPRSNDGQTAKSPALVRENQALTCENGWAYQDLNLGPHPYQGCALTD